MARLPVRHKRGHLPDDPVAEQPEREGTNRKEPGQGYGLGVAASVGAPAALQAPNPPAI